MKPSSKARLPADMTLWLDKIVLDPGGSDSDSVAFYGRRIPATVVVISIAAKCSPESILNRAEEIRRVVLKIDRKPVSPIPDLPSDPEPSFPLPTEESD